ncbi:MAG: 50S ribosomal protein L9 [Candidatus Omnitrophica bacterium]|nr:50S ribosomal protein L9 [Candidatus Omnitrophota bacterium]
MDLILLKDVATLGKTGQKVSVKDGYARNFLIPNGLAVPATGSQQKQVASLLAAREKKAVGLLEKAKKTAKQIENAPCAISVSVGQQGKMHGAVTAADIAAVLKEKGFSVDKHQILLDAPLSTIGTYAVSVKLHQDVTAVLRLDLVAKS